MKLRRLGDLLMAGESTSWWLVIALGLMALSAAFLFGVGVGLNI